MSDLIKRHTAKWLGFWITVMLYVLGQAATDLLAWLNEIGESKFSTGLTTWCILTLMCKMVISAVFTIRALQNGTYQETKKTP